MSKKIEAARKKYRPVDISCIFLAEAPPKTNSKRFFYFEDVPKGDTLYRQTMQALYPEEFVNLDKDEINDKLKSEKKYFLTKFFTEGFYLMDAALKPMPDGAKPTEKKKILRAALPKLKHRLQPFVVLQTPIILIASTVFDVCFEPLINMELKILNNYPIKFPIGYQPEYKKGILKCLKDANLHI